MQEDNFQFLAIPLQRVLKVIKDHADSGNTHKATKLERVVIKQLGTRAIDGNNPLQLVKVPVELY